MPYCLKSKEFNELESYGYIYDGTNLKQIWYWYMFYKICVKYGLQLRTLNMKKHCVTN